VLNCPGSGAGGGGIVTPTTRIGGTTVGTTCPTGRCGATFCATCQSKSRQLNGIPVESPVNSVGDTKITNTFDCGDITVNEPAPVSPVVVTPVIITPQ
jgi:hypothetical protein